MISFFKLLSFFQYSKLYWSDIYQNYIRRWQWASSMYGILRSFNLKLTNQIKANTRAGLLLVKYYTYHIWTELSFSADLSLLASPLLLEAASSSPCFLLISVFGFCKHVTRIKYSIVNFFWRFLLIYHPKTKQIIWNFQQLLSRSVSQLPRHFSGWTNEERRFYNIL